MTLAAHLRSARVDLSISLCQLERDAEIFIPLCTKEVEVEDDGDDLFRQAAGLNFVLIECNLNSRGADWSREESDAIDLTSNELCRLFVANCR